MEVNFKKNDKVELKIDSVAAGGEGVARADDLVVFVPYSAPGDAVLVEIDIVKKSYACGHIKSISAPSAVRTHPVCRYFGKCGGCAFQHINYEAQLEIKRRIVADNITRIGKVDGELVLPVKGMALQLGYRNKVQFVVARAKGKTDLGLYERDSHRHIAIDCCPLQNTLSNSILSFLQQKISDYKWSVYDEKTCRGLLRHMMIRTSGSEALLVPVFSREPENIETFASQVRSLFPQIRGVVININSRSGNVILGDRFRLISGENFICEEILDKKFRISAGSFFQINSEGAAMLAEIVRGSIAENLSGTVCDAYCGSGFFSMFLAGKFRRVVGIEEFAPAVEDARQNAAINKIENAEFIAGRTENVLLERIATGESFDAMVFDPPRKGLEPEIIDKVSQVSIPRVVYVSCNPATLARDLAIFNAKGYTVQFIQPLDMFPQTAHVETVVLMSRAGI